MQLRRGLGEWLPEIQSRRRADDDFGALLAPEGAILRESISKTCFNELMGLDDKAGQEPGSITAVELERARDLAGIPTLLVRQLPAARRFDGTSRFI